jgi:hypothetical protein
MVDESVEEEEVGWVLLVLLMETSRRVERFIVDRLHCCYAI